MAYVIEKKQKDLTRVKELINEFTHTLPHSNKSVKLVLSHETHHVQMQELLNTAISEGGSYPQESALSLDQFKAYYLSGVTFCAVYENNENEVLGCFYIKPNFPGNCSHICNGGFLTLSSARRQGIGMFMGACYLKLARALEYRASMFNLVFVTNEASLRLWRSLGFKEIGRIPGAGHFGNDYIDAIQFYYDLTTIDV